MEDQEIYQSVVNSLRSAIGLLDLQQDSPLRKDVIALCDHLENPTFRIAVFGPFNYGKSTLLNALLGKRTLPIGLIPTTGAAIHIRYGEELHTRITLTDGTEISENSTEVLKRYAILDEQRCMRSDVASVEVYCPHPFLKTGVEFLDLPGTNDREAQDKLVRDQLLTADLVVQVLDGRQLMTLGERENLRDWLIDRGIKTIVFVVNFLNLLEPNQQKEVQTRLRFVAESFRSELPNTLSNLYRVDALPALRARLKGLSDQAHTTGLAMFESALQSMVAAQREKTTVRLDRVDAIATQVKAALQSKIQVINSELETAQQKHQAKLELQQKAQKLIKQGFQASISDFESWLYLPKLLERYQSKLATALQQGEFSTWQAQFQQDIDGYQQAIQEWVDKACEFFEHQSSGKLIISVPDTPQVIIPEPPDSSEELKKVIPIALSTGIRLVLKGKVGAAMAGGASYILSKGAKKDKSDSSPDSYDHQVAQALSDAAQNYLSCFSTDAFSMVRQYQAKAEKVISLPRNQEPQDVSSQVYQLQLLNSVLERLN
ncbi:MAG: dynamin [Moorea sp. SIO3G5]|nr:dynamin [Moorena sp. SIO3G5]